MNGLNNIFLNLFLLLPFISVSQTAFPKVKFEKQINTSEGLEDRICYHVNRQPNGVYNFITSKLQFHTGSQFLDESLDVSLIKIVSPQYFMTENYEVFDYSLNKLSKSFDQSLEIVNGFKVQEEIYILARSKDDYQVSKWDIDKWSKVFEFKNKEEITSVAYSEDTWYGLSKSFHLIDLSNDTLIFDATQYPDRSIPNEYVIHEHEGAMFFSFESKYGVFRFANDRIDLISDNYIIDEFCQDKKGNALMLLKDEVRVIEKVILIDKNCALNPWDALLNDHTNIITSVYSDNFLDDMLISTYSGIRYLDFENSEGFIKSHLSTEKDNWGFGRLVIDVAANKSNQIVCIDEVGRISINSDEGFKTIWEAPFDERMKQVYYDDHSRQFKIISYESNDQGGIYSLDIDDRKLIKEFQTGSLFSIYQRNDTTYIGGPHSRFYRLLDGNLKQFDLSSVLNGMDIRSIYKSDIFLVGTPQGLFNLQGPIDDIELIQLWPSVITEEVRTIEMYNNHFFIGTYGNGLIVLDEKLDLVAKIDEECCSVNNYIYAVVQDDYDRYWLSTNDGLFVLDKALKFQDRIGLSYGISDLEFNTQAAVKSKDGDLFFGTVNGLTEIQPSKYLKSDNVDFIVKEIRGYLGNDVYYSPTNGNVGEFNFKPDSVKFFLVPSSFKEVNYHYASKNDFKIEGHLDFKIYKNQITLTDLDFGQLNLAINAHSDHFTLLIKRNYWKYVSNFLLLSIVVLLTSSVVYTYVNKVAKRKVKEISLQKEISQIKLEALRSQMNPHFIFNSLGAISYYIQSKETRVANNYLTKFAKLIRAFLESSKNEYLSLAEEIKLLNYYLQLEKLRFEDAFDYEINCDASIDKLHEVIPTMMVQPFVENALIHGVSHLKDRKGIIKINFLKETEDVLKIVIDDNGVGRMRAAEIKKSSLKKHQSRAMQIIEDRIKVSEFSDEMGLTLEIIDKYDGESPMGTQVVINVINKN